MGISVGLAFVVWVFYALEARDDAKKKAAESIQTPPRWFKRLGPKAALKVSSHEVHNRGTDPIVLGTILNEGADSWSRILLEAHFFDKAGKLVALCPGWSSGTIRPGQQRYFTINCGHDSGMAVPAYTTYQVEIVEAVYEMEDGT